MVYPLLVRKMQAALQSEGVAPCYCVVRRARVLEGHLKLKFECVAEYGVLARPLRPARLLRRITNDPDASVRRRAIGWAASVARPIDALAVATTRALSLPGPRVAAAGVEDLVPLMTGRPPGSIVWSLPQLTSRLRPAIDGEACRARRVGHEAGLIWRMARRGGVDVAAILDLVGRDAAATRRLLRGACGEAVAAGADVALWLDGAPEQRATLRRTGFFATSERYSLVAWPKGSLDASALRFAFLDHDAF
jgi:hypothetical protein